MHFVTYSDLLEIAMIVVASITLVYTVLMYKHKK